jgi:DNA recombination protein RmuC
MTVIALIAGLLLGAAAVYLWARAELARREARVRTDEQWEEHLKAVTADTLSASSTSLLDLADAKLQPIKETLERFEQQSRALEQKRAAEIGAIPQLVESLRRETGSLVTALRSPHVRGGWGEMQLKRVVELAGMVAHCDFVEQATSRDDEGRLLRPDLVVKLPGGKNVVVDSKTPLEAYLDASAAEDDDVRRTHLTRHAKLVRDHMTKLGQKRYWQQFEPAPEFVVMFVDEGLFRAALDHDPALFRTVAYCWQQETVAESAREVSRLGRELYDRLGVFAGHFAKVGRALDSAVETYNKAVGSFETRVLVTARKFPEHGAGGEEPAAVAAIDRQSRPLFAPELEAGDEVARLPTRAA